MSNATAAAAPDGGKRKLIVIAGIAALVLAGGGAAAVALMKKPADADDPDAPAAVVQPAPRPAAGTPPLFVPLDMFTVNLADRNADRYAQIGMTLEIDGSSTADRVKAYMPAIRNNILMAIADRSAADLLGREGKTLLAERVKREAARALGYDVEDEDEGDVDEAEAPRPSKKKKKRRAAVQELPVRAVHFSNFIIQ